MNPFPRPLTNLNRPGVSYALTPFTVPTDCRELYRDSGSVFFEKLPSPQSCEEATKWPDHYAEIHKAVKAIRATLKPAPRSNMFTYLKEYFHRNRDTIITIVGVVLIDHFFLRGALRQKIQSVLEKVLSAVEHKLSPSEAK